MPKRVLPLLLLLSAPARGAGETPLALEPVVTTASRRPVPAAAQATNTARLEDIAAVAATHPAELFTRVPGAWISRGSGQEHLTAIRSPVLTGPGSCGAFLFLENGLPVRPAGFCNVNQLIEINTEQADAVEVVRGPGSALYGSNALHGTINSIVGPAPDGGGALVLESGPDDYYRLRVDGGAGPARVLANVTHDGGFRDSSGFDQGKLNAVLDLGPVPGALRLDFAATDLQQETAGFVTGENAYRDDALRETNPNPEAFRDADSQRAAVRWSTELAPGTLVVRAYARRSRMEFLQHFLPGQPLERNGQDSLGSAMSLLMEPGEGLVVNVGLDAELTDGFLVERQSAPTGGSAFLRETRPAGLHYDYRVDAAMAAPWVHAEWHAAPRWWLEAAARYEHMRYDYDNRTLTGNTREDGSECGFGGCLYNRPADRVDRFDNVAPRFGARFAATPDVDLWLSLARGFRAPQATELYRLQSQQNVADLDSETLDTLELGLRRRGRRSRLELAAFAGVKRNFIFRDAEGFNVSDGRTEHAGVELDLQVDLSSSLSLAATATRARHRYDFERAAGRGENIADGNDVDTAPRHFGDLRLTWRPLPALSAELQWQHLGEYFLDAANSQRYPGHDLLHLRARWALGARWTVAARVHNVTDRRYAERADFAFGGFRYFPGRERSLFLEIAWTGAGASLTPDRPRLKNRG